MSFIDQTSFIALFERDGIRRVLMSDHFQINAQNREMDDVKKVNRKKGRKEGRQVGLARAPAAEHIDGSLSRQCVSQFEYFSHSPTTTNACMPKEGKRGEKNEVRRGAKIIVSRLCPPERLRDDDFSKFFITSQFPTAARYNMQRFSGTIILANKSSTSLSCTLRRRMPMVGKPREICSIACEERETPASMLWKQRAVFRAISSFRVFRFPSSYPALHMC